MKENVTSLCGFSYKDRHGFHYDRCKEAWYKYHKTKWSWVTSSYALGEYSRNPNFPVTNAIEYAIQSETFRGLKINRSWIQEENRGFSDDSILLDTNIPGKKEVSGYIWMLDDQANQECTGRKITFNIDVPNNAKKTGQFKLRENMKDVEWAERCYYLDIVRQFFCEAFRNLNLKSYNDLLMLTVDIDPNKDCGILKVHVSWALAQDYPYMPGADFPPSFIFLE